MRSLSAPLGGVYLALFLSLAALPTAALSAEGAPGPLSGKLLELDDGVVLAGALNPEALAASAPVTVVDLRTVAEGTAEEAEAAAASGHDYHNLPVPGAVVEAHTLSALRQILDDPERGTVVVHCASGNRAALIYGALALEAGDTLGEVQTQLGPLLTREGAINALAAYAESVGAEP